MQAERERGLAGEEARARAVEAWPWPGEGEPWTAYLERLGRLDGQEAA
jgi:hypothetical protein